MNRHCRPRALILQSRGMAARLPEDFICPISLEVMSDPVILSSGHTFDRASIQRWLDAGHRTCPISKLPLPEPPSLIPNHALRSLISNYAAVSLRPRPQSCPPSLQTLTQLLLSPSLEEKLTSLDRLNRVSKHDSSTRRGLAESGAVPAVLQCVDSSEPGIQEKALLLLLNLSLEDDGKVGLVAEGSVGRVVRALRFGVGDSRAVAATVLTSLAVVEVNKATIGSHPDAIPGLIDLLRAGNSRERKEAATALYTLCSFAGNRIQAFYNGAIPVLIQNAAGGLERAVEVLGLLAKCSLAREEMANSGGVVDMLIAIAGNGSSRGVQYALLTLSYLCSYSERIGLEALRQGMFEVCIGLLNDDNQKVRRNAKSLIHVLQNLMVEDRCN
ncbi:U-box domain-containing protein 8-like [Andrographis paniculata]|uniref:U-box domain-containing protein 8-like n=1 Tax=Andrographis paniculata TaxID=175694 RepID=UPI0021E715F6|nr:U-box domain-containing protein 8-like [Andrographis paniculata]